MQTIKFPVLVLVLVARLCRAEVVIESLTPDKSTSDLVEALVTVVTSCYGDRIHGIGLAGDLPDTLVRRLSTQHSIPVALIDYSTKNKPYWVPVETRHKLQIFIVGASSYQQLGRIINLSITFSIWWNHMASFIILDRSHRCKAAPLYLNVAWQLDIINAKVMCYGVNGEIIVKTTNPCANLAPAPWKKEGRFRGKHGHPFTVFYREVGRSETTCVNFHLCKVRDCGGYPISIKGTRHTDLLENFDGDEAGKNFLLVHEHILSNVYRALNVNPTYFSDGSHGEIDMEVPATWLYNSWNHRLVSDTYMQTGFILLSQFRGNKSQLQKILGVIDTNSHIGLGVAYLVTLIFFRFVVRQALVPAILNLIRITCGAGFENLPRSDPSRIYLTGILFFAVTMHGIFEGNLAALLTTVIPVRNINTMQDLVDFDYTLYGYDDYISSKLEAEVRERFVQVKSPMACVTTVADEKSSACIISLIGSALDVAKDFNLHTSEPVITSYAVFKIRWDWPLEEKFNILLSRLVEADALEPWFIKCNPMKLEDFQTDQDVKQNKEFKNIELSELTFAFVILGIGLVFASIAFVVELGIHYGCRRVCRVRVWETINTKLSCLHRCK